MPKAQEILTSEFFNKFALNYGMPVSEQNLMTWIVTHENHLAKHVVLNYKDLEFFDDLEVGETEFNANYAFALLGINILRIYNALVVDYNPLENYFTDRTMGTTTDNTDTRTGDVEKTKGGSIDNAKFGSRNRNYNGHTNLGQATTFETFGDNDFRNVSKNTENGTITDTFSGYGTTTTFHNYVENTKYKTLQDKHDGQEDIEEHRSGNSGIFSKQDLTQRELTLRESNLFMKTFVRMLVDAFNTGVW